MSACQDSKVLGANPQGDFLQPGWGKSGRVEAPPVLRVWQYFWDAGANREVTPHLILPGHPNARHSSIAVSVQVGKLRHWAVKRGAETGGGQLFLGLGETPGLGKVMAGQR